MKKIIAAAVATAFVAPVFAGEITIVGSMELAYVDEKDTTAATQNKAINEESEFKFVGTSETASGISITAEMDFNGAGSTDGNHLISLGGDFGKVTLGDTSGVIDHFDDKTDVLVNYDLGAQQGSNDAAASWVLPELAPGLQIIASYTPKNGATASILDEGGAVEGVGPTADMSGIGVGYSFAGGRVHYAEENVGTDEFTSVGAVYTIQGLTLAYEQNEKTAAGGTKTDNTMVALTYTMGDVTLAYSSQTLKSGGSTSSDDTGIGVKYDLGGGLTAFAETYEDSKEVGEGTAVGVAYKF